VSRVQVENTMNGWCNPDKLRMGGGGGGAGGGWGGGGGGKGGRGGGGGGGGTGGGGGGGGGGVGGGGGGGGKQECFPRANSRDNAPRLEDSRQIAIGSAATGPSTALPGWARLVLTAC